MLFVLNLSMMIFYPKALLQKIIRCHEMLNKMIYKWVVPADIVFIANTDRLSFLRLLLQIANDIAVCLGDSY